MTHTIIAQGFKKFKPIYKMKEIAFCDFLARYVLEVKSNDPWDHIDYFLNFFASRKTWLADFEDLDHVFAVREDDFTDLKVDLFLHENFDLVDVALDADVLESGDSYVDNFLFR